jgi:hypothetical protein
MMMHSSHLIVVTPEFIALPPNKQNPTFMYKSQQIETWEIMKKFPFVCSSYLIFCSNAGKMARRTADCFGDYRWSWGVHMHNTCGWSGFWTAQRKNGKDDEFCAGSKQKMTSACRGRGVLGSSYTQVNITSSQACFVTACFVTAQRTQKKNNFHFWRF